MNRAAFLSLLDRYDREHLESFLEKHGPDALAGMVAAENARLNLGAAKPKPNAIPEPPESPQEAPKSAEVVYHPQDVKIWPCVGLAAAQSNQGGAWRLWALARNLNRSGSGVVSKRELYNYLDSLGCHPRTRRRWVRDAKQSGIISETKNKKGERIYCLRSLGKAAAALGASSIGRPAVIKGGAKKLLEPGWAAWLWAGWTAAKNGYQENPKPIAQETKRELTGVAPRTQRKYQRISGSKSIANYAPRPDIKTAHVDNLKDVTGWTFFVDGEGNTNQRLPDLVLAPLSVDVTKRGRSRKAQRELPRYSSIERREPFSEAPERIYYDTRKDASRAAERQPKAALLHGEQPPDRFYRKQHVRYLEGGELLHCNEWGIA
jgi:hypothetical protein